METTGEQGIVALSVDHDSCDDPEHFGDLYSAECPCRDILDLVASKWSALIIGRLEERVHRFGELRRAIPGITQKMLTQTLRRLEQDGLVERTVLAQKRPPQVEYSLTDLGRTVTEPLAAMRDWTEQHLPDVRAARRRFEELEPV
ncbi:winged helix-turn-helix transcriptional regulator [Ilumatobacter coccineus]|uniref:Putative HxlR family transcriptional regulator n=1 Tax=Ilumatobacter coccineus (strain NBRC 103263 / KCTC 29153 / YM16-304) TaxID=1313172 RepID=A0A6C7E0V6_ILUCY|nr:helix-turn-helix domain-containing protein [Ilumatobacter coccineus]BAN00897.1 putative HxlR family transcriptional regulator [Ilumatobacter coccineus YM16-304]